MRALFVLTPAILIAAPFALLGLPLAAIVFVCAIGLGIQCTQPRPERGEYL